MNLLGETRAADTDSSTNRSHVCVPAVPRSLRCGHRARRVPSLPTLPPKPSLTGPPGTMLLQMCAQAPAVHVTHPTAPSRCTPSVAHARTEICHFTKIHFSNHLLDNFIVLFSAAERAVWVSEHRMGKMRSRALPCTWTHAPMAPPISVHLQNCSLGSSCHQWYQDKLSWEFVHSVCPPSASPGPSPGML